MDLGPHASFIIVSYAITAATIAALAIWIAADYRTQRRTLHDLEASGVTRRSQHAAKETP